MPGAKRGQHIPGAISEGLEPLRMKGPCSERAPVLPQQSPAAEPLPIQCRTVDPTEWCSACTPAPADTGVTARVKVGLEGLLATAGSERAVPVSARRCLPGAVHGCSQSLTACSGSADGTGRFITALKERAGILRSAYVHENSK